MVYRILADMVVLVHFGFVLFAVLGGALAFWRRKIVWIHIPVVVWAVLIEWAGWICPLTPLENILRLKGGEAGYSGGFVEHYIMPLLYPENLTRTVQIVLGFCVLLLNAVIYWRLVATRRRQTGRKRKGKFFF